MLNFGPLTTGAYCNLVIRQQPAQARVCGIGINVDRRPVDPPPVLQLVERPAANISTSTSTSANNSNGIGGRRGGVGGANGSISSNGSTSTTFFRVQSALICTATLCEPDSPHTEVMTLSPRDSTDTDVCCTMGTLVTSIQRLRDETPDGPDVGFFIFPDISIRQHGTYVLRFDAYQLMGPQVTHLARVYSNPFEVHNAKTFGGMLASTSLDLHIAKQGVKLRIRSNRRRISKVAIKRQMQQAARGRPSSASSSRGASGRSANRHADYDEDDEANGGGDYYDDDDDGEMDMDEDVDEDGATDDMDDQDGDDDGAKGPDGNAAGDDSSYDPPLSIKGVSLPPRGGRLQRAATIDGTPSRKRTESTGDSSSASKKGRKQGPTSSAISAAAAAATLSADKKCRQNTETKSVPPRGNSIN